MAYGGCPGIPDGTVRFPDWLGFGLASKTSTRDRVVLVGRLDDRCERSVRSFLFQMDQVVSDTFSLNSDDVRYLMSR